MSQRTKQEWVDTVRPRYCAATRAEKGLILDELEANTGYHRKYVIHLLRQPQEVPVRRKHRYSRPVQAAPVKVWRAANCICRKRLLPCLEWFVSAMERHGELTLDSETRSTRGSTIAQHSPIQDKLWRFDEGLDWTMRQRFTLGKVLS